MSRGERVVLVDGTGLLFRAYHAIPANLKTTAGLPTNAAYGFAQMFRKVLAGRLPAYGAVVFDAGGPTFRSGLFPAYKAQRPPMPDALVAQLPSIDALVRAHRFPIVRERGVEADDVIGTLCRRALAAGHDVWVVSGDKDLAQLVGDDVRMLDSTKEVLYDPDTVFRKWGVPPERLPDLLGLVGDAVDGIPGVPGIGDKTATALLAEHGTLDAVLAAADAGMPGRTGNLLREHRAIAELSRRLATLNVEVPLAVGLDDLKIALPAPEDLDDIYLALEFWSLLSPSAATRLPKQTPIRYFVCDTPEMARAALAAECHGPDPTALHVLIDEPDHLRGPIIGIALSPALGTGLYFPFAGPGTHLGLDGLDVLHDWLEDPTRPKTTHEGKRATVALARHGIALRGVVGDAALASYLVDPTKHLPHRLEQIAREYLHVGLQPIRGLLGTGKQRRRFVDLTIDKAGAWSCHCADATGAAWRALAPRLEAEGLWDLLHDVDLPLSDVLARMELAGVRIAPEILATIGARLADERAALTDAIATLAGRRFNPGSHRQLGQVLFEELGLPIVRRTKTGYAVDAEVLDDLADRHPVIPAVSRWRTVDKLIHTYTDVLQAAIEPDGRIHPTFQQTVGAAGRLITTEPDLQRTPVRTEEFREVREAFVASDGNLLISADFSQIELRVLAHVTGDPELVAAYRDGRDIHRATASALFDLAPDEIDARQRDIAKTVNFATIYGQGPLALARQLGIPVAEARAYIAAFFDRYAGVADWRREVVDDAVKRGFVTTVLGRRRYIPELFSNDPTERSYGERIATNSPIQGSAADLCKIAMLRVDHALRHRGSRARLVLQIHDELVLDVPSHEVDAVVPVVKAAMEGAVALDVPLVVEVGVGPTWAAAH
ncbi:MAG: DNA polymerase I [Myxococcota bacterium]